VTSGRLENQEQHLLLDLCLARAHIEP
jgi:hypothetical protein